MSSEIQTRQSQAPATLDQLVRSSTYTARFNEVLKDRAPQFMASILSVGRTMPDVEPKSIVAAAMQAAVLNLPIEKSFGFAWIVPYREGGKKFAQFQCGAKGYVQMALRTGQYTRMNARCINKEALIGTDEVGEPIIDWNRIDPEKPVEHYVFTFKLANGFSKVACWSKARVTAHANQYSQSFKSGFNSPWKTNFNEMALKSVVKNELSDWGILSVDMARAFGADQAIQRTPEDEPEFMDVPTVSAPPETVIDDNPELAPVPPRAAPVKPAVKAEPKTAKPAPMSPMPATPAPAPSPALAAMLADEPQPEPAEPMEPEPATEQWTVQTELKNFCVGQKFGLGIFLKWALGAKWLTEEEIGKIDSWDKIPQTVAVRCLRSKTGFVKGLTDTVNGGGL